jgi:hypothetical protein
MILSSGLVTGPIHHLARGPALVVLDLPSPYALGVSVPPPESHKPMPHAMRLSRPGSRVYIYAMPEQESNNFDIGLIELRRDV